MVKIIHLNESIKFGTEPKRCLSFIHQSNNLPHEDSIDGLDRYNPPFKDFTRPAGVDELVDIKGMLNDVLAMNANVNVKTKSESEKSESENYISY